MDLQPLTCKTLLYVCLASHIVQQVVKETGESFNIFEQSRLNDMVYVKFNCSLNRRTNRKDNVDPILLKEIDESNEWLFGRLEEDKDDNLVFEGEDLTWDAVEKASGVNEPFYATKASRDDRGKGIDGSSGLGLVDEEIEEDIGMYGDEEGDMDMELGFDFDDD
uniref:Uncharacterized protein n=1 Tax=Lactuca sativa TaxID=4236 RepID=A0A9R1XVB9_LACSA|nr:hypothetical protein LSAT_V11C200067570 [Lactuca sativa]